MHSMFDIDDDFDDDEYDEMDDEYYDEDEVGSDPFQFLTEPLDLFVMSAGFTTNERLIEDFGERVGYLRISDEVVNVLLEEGHEFLNKHAKELNRLIPAFRDGFWDMEEDGPDEMMDYFWRAIGRIYMAYRTGAEDSLLCRDRGLLGEPLLQAIQSKPTLKVKLKKVRDRDLGSVAELVLVPPRKPRSKKVA